MRKLITFLRYFEVKIKVGASITLSAEGRFLFENVVFMFVKRKLAESCVFFGYLLGSLYLFGFVFATKATMLRCYPVDFSEKFLI